MDQAMKFLVKILFMSTQRCKTATYLAMAQTMKLLVRRLFMFTLRCRTGIKVKKLLKDLLFISEQHVYQFSFLSSFFLVLNAHVCISKKRHA